MDFAKYYVQKPPSFWEPVIFSDESQFNIFGSDGWQKVLQKANQTLKTKNMRPIFKHGGGGIMSWGCISVKGLVPYITYCKWYYGSTYLHRILWNNLQQRANKLSLGLSFKFQQDNDPKHVAMGTKELAVLQYTRAAEDTSQTLIQSNGMKLINEYD